MERKFLIVFLALMAAILVTGYFKHEQLTGPEMAHGPPAPTTLEVSPLKGEPDVRMPHEMVPVGEGGMPSPPPELALPAKASSAEWSGSLESAFVVPGREISINVDIQLVHKDPRAAALRVMDIASSLGGYVQHSTIGETTAFVTVKVPSDQLDEAMRSIRSIGEVTREEMSTIDLTERVVDVESRLRNYRAQEQRLLELLERAETIDEILKIEDRLANVRSYIERLEGMLKRLKNQVTYSTINVEILREKPKVEPPKEPTIWDRIVEDATKALLGSLYIIVVGAAFLLLPALLVAAAYVTVARMRARGGGGGQGPP